jgi:hypothetical protein
VHIVASADAVELVRSSGGRLYVWSTRSWGCQPVTRLHASAAPAPGRAFVHAEFDAVDLYLAEVGHWPPELGLDVYRGRVRALWDGAVCEF